MSGTRPAGDLATSPPVELRVHGVGGSPPHSLLNTDPGNVRRIRRAHGSDETTGFFRVRVEDPDDPEALALRGVQREAYSWGGLTSRSGRRAGWIFAAPLAVVNMGGFVLDSSAVPSRARAVYRVGALWLTVWITSSFQLITMDMIAFQCGRTSCVDEAGWRRSFSWLTELAPATGLLLSSVLPLLLLAGALWLFRDGSTARTHGKPIGSCEQTSPPPATSAEKELGRRAPPDGLASATFWDPAREKSLRHAHIVAVMSTLGLGLAVALGDVGAEGGTVVAGLFVALLVAASTSAVTSRTVRGIVAAGAAWLPLVVLALLDFAGEANAVESLADFRVVFRAIELSGWLIAAALLIAARPSFKIAATAIGLFSLGWALAATVLWSLEFWTAHRLPTNEAVLQVPEAHESIPVAAAGMAVLLLSLVAAWTIIQWVRGRVSDEKNFFWGRVRDGVAKGARRAAGGGWVVGLLSLAIALSPGIREFLQSAPLVAFSALAENAVLLLPAFGLLLLRRLFSSRSVRRRVGILWDLCTLWPRDFHPFAPPPYAGRAVRELTERGNELDEEGSDFVLAGHSAGSVLCLAAAFRLRGVHRFRGLLTYGSPLGGAYSTTFGAVIDGLIRSTAEVLVSSNRAWVNLTRPTDPIASEIVAPGVENLEVEGAGHSNYEVEEGYGDALLDFFRPTSAPESRDPDAADPAPAADEDQ